MRSTGNFHPEWGYLAPSSNFIRTARIVLIALAIGGIVGASVVLSMVERPASETSVAARTLTGPGEVVSVPVGTPPAAQEKAQADPGSTQNERSDQQRSGGSVPSAPSGVAAVPEVPAASVSSPTKRRFYQGPAPTQKKASRKPHPTSRYASRGERVIGDREPRRQPLFGLNVPAEYYPRRGNSGYYRERRWGDYYPEGGFDYN
jgi:hypothetical protein